MRTVLDARPLYGTFIGESEKNLGVVFEYLFNVEIKFFHCRWSA